MTVRLTPLSLDDGMPMDAWQRARKLQLLGGERFVDPVVGSGLAAPRDDMSMGAWQSARDAQVRNGDVGAFRPSTLNPRLYDLVARASDPPAQMMLAEAKSTPMSAGQWEVESARAAGWRPDAGPAPTPRTTEGWAESHVGRPGYDRWTDNAPDAQGRVNDLLPRPLKGMATPSAISSSGTP